MDSPIINPLATPAYVPFDPNAPNGATQAPDAYAASDLANIRALRDAVVCGHIPGYAFSISGGTNAAPTYRIWAANPIQFRMWTVTYDATITYLPLSVKWQWSNDSGASWVDMDATAAVLTWDTTGGAAKLLTASRDAGAWCIALNALIAGLYAGSNLGAHTAQTGTAVHGLGSMSTQNANAVNVTGGNIAAAIANSTIDNSAVTHATRLAPSAPPTLANNAAWNWAATPTHCIAAAVTVITDIQGAFHGEIKRVMVAGGQITINSATANIRFAQGFAWGTASQTNTLSLVCLVVGAQVFIVISNTIATL